jgi:DNA polymerase-3 subunit alpha
LVMEKERERFLEGAKKNGINAALATTIFEKIETFASYGFNRSHAAAYALTTYTTAYLKAHFPLQFMAALMSLDMDDVAKTYKNIAALRDMKIRILPPDVNQSRVKFAVTDDAIRFGLAAIRGVGAKAGEAIVAVREAGGPFETLTDFCLRVGAQLVSRRVLEALIKCGAFDSLGQARAALMAQAELAIKLAQKAQSDAEKNQIGLFGGAVKVPKMPAREPIPEWDAREKLKFEKEALGFYITAHPLDKYDRELSRISKLTTADLPAAPDGSAVQIAGVIQAVKLKNNKSGKRYATFSLEDREGAVEAIAWSETYQKFEAIIMGEEPVLARGKLDVDDERAQIILESLVPLDSALIDSVREVRIKTPLAWLDNGGLDALKQLLARYRGKSMTYLQLGLVDGGEAVVLLGDAYRVSPTDSFVTDVERILAPGAVELR